MEKGESEEKGTKRRGGWLALYAINPFSVCHAQRLCVGMRIGWTFEGMPTQSRWAWHPRSTFCPFVAGTDWSKAMRSKPKQAPTRLYARTAQGAGPRPCFEGAHCVRRCALVFESAHLGKSRRFLRRCAPFCKVRTKTAHLRRIRAPRSSGPSSLARVPDAGNHCEESLGIR